MMFRRRQRESGVKLLSRCTKRGGRRVKGAADTAERLFHHAFATVDDVDALWQAGGINFRQ